MPGLIAVSLVFPVWGLCSDLAARELLSETTGRWGYTQVAAQAPLVDAFRDRLIVEFSWRRSAVHSVSKLR
ncbi:MAG: hypothetical protein GWP04_10625 [Gammaproteobacteria bacterium]|nr:hypothetical protein [Gammaproteobacteria bacterium]